VRKAKILQKITGKFSRKRIRLFIYVVIQIIGNGKNECNCTKYDRGQIKRVKICDKKNEMK
jgi:hypothetical protein